MSNLYECNAGHPGYGSGGHMKPVPPPPPYMPPHGHDSYSHDGYHEYHGHPHPHEYPTHGPMLGSGFYLLNYNPFLFDTTHVKYGNFLSVSENVITRISRRRDESCINLDASFNLTGQVIRNAVMQQHLEQSIANHFDTLEGYLPIVKSDITLRMYYTVQDDMGGVVHQAVCTVTTPQMNFHYTDIRDYFVTSLKSIFVANIPAMDYTGMYRLNLEKIEVFADVIDTKEHVSNNMNPYYQFADNNNKIILQHETIQHEIPDHSVLIASAKINEVISFQANVTTRLRISFVAFLSELIATPNTYGIWNAMFAPTDEKIDKAFQEIATLKESVTLLTNNVTEMNHLLTDLTNTVSQNSQEIADLKMTCSNLNVLINNKTEDLQAMLDDHEYRIKTLEQRPLALVRYQTGNSYVRSQLTYSTYGDLYQVAKDFTATTMDSDIEAGNIVMVSPGGSIIIDQINDRIEALDTSIETVTASVNTISETVSTIDDRVDDVETNVTTVTSTVADLTERVDNAEEVLAYTIVENDTIQGGL